MTVIDQIGTKLPRHRPCAVAAGELVYQRLAAAAYQIEVAARSSAAAFGFTLVEHIRDDATGADAMVFQNDEQVVIAFRGTEKNHADIVTDLKFRLTAFMDPPSGPPIRVHRGFLAQWIAIKDRIYKIATAALAGRRELVATGHSLGGALAVLAAVDWRWITACVTFGAPRVGDANIIAAARLLGVQHRRYVFGADVVPIVPLLAMGYRHDVAPTYLTRSGRAIRRCPLWRELLGRARSLLSIKWEKSWSWCPVPTRMFTDHRIGEYGAAMRRAAS